MEKYILYEDTPAGYMRLIDELNSYEEAIEAATHYAHRRQGAIVIMGVFAVVKPEKTEIPVEVTEYVQ